METLTNGYVEWGVASRSYEGDSQCGDMYSVKLLPQGALIGVVDGLGHGSEAAAVARIAIDTIESNAGESLISLMSRCHGALRQTRGAVISLAAMHPGEGTMSWLGVGNIQGFLCHANGSRLRQETLLLQPGVLGDHLPGLHTTKLPVTQGDVLLFATDGVDPELTNPIFLSYPARQVAEGILARHSRGTDDALVLVARCKYGKNDSSSR